MHKKDELGRYGEAIGARYLERHGWSIRDRNWRCNLGEIDIVAERAGVIAICEVKTRRSTKYGTPLEAVTSEKFHRLRRLAARWLSDHTVHTPMIRIDIITVLVDSDGSTHVRHIEAVEA